MGLIKNFIHFIFIAVKVKWSFCVLVLLSGAINFAVTILEIRSIFFLVESLQYRDMSVFITRFIPIISLSGIFRILLVFVSSKVKKHSQIFILDFEKQLLVKTMTLPFEKLESPEFISLKERVDFSIYHQGALGHLIEATVELIKSASTLFSMLLILSLLSPFLLIISVVSVVLVSFVRLKFNKYETDFFNNLGDINRDYWYFGRMLFDYNKMLDIKANKMEKIIDAKFGEKTDECIKYFNYYYKKKALVSSMIAGINLSNVLFFALYTGLRAFEGIISFASFNFYMSAAIRFSANLGAISEHMLDLQRMCGFLAPVLDLLGMNSLKAENTINEKNSDIGLNEELVGISFKDVAFSYPGVEKTAVAGISFDLKKDSIVSIVGENGVGKTTVVKLICGLYHPQQGNVFIPEYTENGNQTVSAIFQDFKLLDDATIFENIITDLDLNENEMERALDKIENLLKHIDIGEFIDINSKLGVGLEEGNISLSAGQKQLVALLRALYHDSEIIILDEPTANIDAKKELALFSSLSYFKKGRIILLISHRMGNVHFADEVLYMENGIIKARGSHDDLLAKEKGYRDLYLAQKLLYE